MSYDETMGGSAFPSKTNDLYLHGMSLLDYFAGQALNGMLASGNTDFANPFAAVTLAYGVAAKMVEQRKNYLNEEDGEDEFDGE